MFEFQLQPAWLGLLMLCSLGMSSDNSYADIIEFTLTGAQGEGLLPGNIEPGTSSTGFGAIGATGLLLNTETNILQVDIAWGSGNGFGDLSGEVTLLHLHGPTPSLPPDNFGEVNPDILVNLANSLNFDSSATSGSLVDEYFLSNAQEEFLLSGRTYINVHTELYPTGEIRGYVLPVSGIPEPSAASVLLALGLLGVCRRRV